MLAFQGILFFVVAEDILVSWLMLLLNFPDTFLIPNPRATSLCTSLP